MGASLYRDDNLLDDDNLDDLLQDETPKLLSMASDLYDPSKKDSGLQSYFNGE